MRAVCLTDDPHEPPPVPIELKPEMAGIAELDDWQPCAAEDLPEQPDWQAAIKAHWDELRPWLQRRVTAAAVRRLFTPVRRDPAGRHVLYEATLDTLPTHHHLVTRWLKVYLIFDSQSKSVQKVTFWNRLCCGREPCGLGLSCGRRGTKPPAGQLHDESALPAGRGIGVQGCKGTPANHCFS